MTQSAIILIIGAALLHAGWNVVSKSKHPSTAFFLVATVAGALLLSLVFVTNVSYVAAFRQLSIPLGVALGCLVLKEPVFAPKVVGVVIIFLGLVLVAMK